jgi:hypothetical protein
MRKYDNHPVSNITHRSLIKYKSGGTTLTQRELVVLVFTK